MAGSKCGWATTIVSAIIAIFLGVIGYVAMPLLIASIVVNEVALKDDSMQLERFQEIPFLANLTVWIWTISNRRGVLNGEVPQMAEVGPYIYRIYQDRLIDKVDGENITYRIRANFDFDPVASAPRTQEDFVMIVNPAYHTILQNAESMFQGTPVISKIEDDLEGIFGLYDGPVVGARVMDILFQGVPICALASTESCQTIKFLSRGARHIVENHDGSLSFSLLGYKSGINSKEYVASRGLSNTEDLGRIVLFDHLSSLRNWPEGGAAVSLKGRESQGGASKGRGRCNMINGTDAGIFPPFVNKTTKLYAFMPDICRSIELRYQNDEDYDDATAYRFAANSWFLEDVDGCFCVNRTGGYGQPKGCLLRGAMELYSCVQGALVLTYPHFLYADKRYRRGIVGAYPDKQDHRTFMDVEPLTGTIFKGVKRLQLNVFMRPIKGLKVTRNLLTTLTPIIWTEESIQLPHSLVVEITSKLNVPLTFTRVVVPLLMAGCLLAFVIGLVLLALPKTNLDDTFIS